MGFCDQCIATQAGLTNSPRDLYARLTGLLGLVEIIGDFYNLHFDLALSAQGCKEIYDRTFSGDD